MRFIYKPSSSFSPDELVLIDEMLDDLRTYDNPEPGKYEPQPTPATLRRAEYARRAERWEKMLKRRRECAVSPSQPVAGTQPASHSESNRCGLADDILLQICRIAADDPELTSQHVDDLRKVCSLIGSQYAGPGAQLELAVSLLGSFLGSFSRYNPTHLPMGYSGPTVKSYGWHDHDTLERTAKQIVGLMWIDCSPEEVALRVEYAISEAVRLGFMEEKQYDAWRPGMPSGSGWRVALAATAYGVTKASSAGTAIPADDCTTLEKSQAPTAPVSAAAQAAEAPYESVQPFDAPSPAGDGPEEDPELPPEVAELAAQVAQLTADEYAYVLRFQLFMYAQMYHNLVETVANSPVGWVDMELNAWYLQVVKGIENLLAMPELADFPNGFEPVAPNLFPCSDLDIGWEDCIGPPVMDFLGRTQAFLLESGPLRPQNEEFVESIMEVCRDKCAQASGVAARFRQQAEATFKKMLNNIGQRMNDSRAIAGTESSPTGEATNAVKSKPRPTPRRGMRTANIEKLVKELEKHLLAARDYAYSLRDHDREPALLPRPTQKELARRTGLTQSDVSRCLRDPRATVLKILWETAESLEEVMKYKRR